MYEKSRDVAPAYNPSAEEAKGGRVVEVTGQSTLLDKLQANKRPCPKTADKWCLRYALVYIQTHTYTPHTYMCTHRDTHRLFLRPLFISGASNLIGIQNA